jgi:Domain of unknown function (DUF4410)
MNTKTRPLDLLQLVMICAATLALAGCATTGEKGAAEATSSAKPATARPSRFKADDGRTIDIGKASASSGGYNYKDPHLEKCWIADGFDFNGFETLYIAPVLSTAKHQPDEEMPLQVAKENLPTELARMLGAKKIFANIVTNAADIKPGTKAVKLEQTITEYSKGGGAARFWVGMYGGGQPVLRVVGTMTDADKTVFTFQGRRSGTSGGARVGGAYMKDTDIQSEDIRSLVLDLTDFVAAITGKYKPLN